MLNTQSPAYLLGFGSVSYTHLDDLQLIMANELEAFHVREHGVENGIEIACAMLSDMVQPDFLEYAPRLTPFGEMVMAGLHDALINATPQPEAH